MSDDKNIPKKKDQTILKTQQQHTPNSNQSIIGSSFKDEMLKKIKKSIESIAGVTIEKFR